MHMPPHWVWPVSPVSCWRFDSLSTWFGQQPQDIFRTVMVESGSLALRVLSRWLPLSDYPPVQGLPGPQLWLSVSSLVNTTQKPVVAQFGSN